MKCHLKADRKGHEHDDRVFAVAQVVHTRQCSSHDGRKDLPAERWDRVDDLHRHCHCVEVENFLWYAEQAGNPLKWEYTK